MGRHSELKTPWITDRSKLLSAKFLMPFLDCKIIFFSNAVIIPYAHDDTKFGQALVSCGMLMCTHGSGNDFRVDIYGLLALKRMECTIAF
jgi:hypothetical protein